MTPNGSDAGVTVSIGMVAWAQRENAESVFAERATSPVRLPGDRSGAGGQLTAVMAPRKDSARMSWLRSNIWPLPRLLSEDQRHQRKRNLRVAFKGTSWYDMQHNNCISQYGFQPRCGGIDPWQSRPKRPTTRRPPIGSKNGSCSEPPARAYGAPSRTRKSLAPGSASNSRARLPRAGRSGAGSVYQATST